MDNQNQSQVPALSGMGNLLKKTWQVYKERLRVFLGIMVIPIFTYLLLTPLVGFLKSFIINSSRDLLSAAFILYAIYAIFWFITAIISLWSFVSLLYAIKERTEKTGVKESFKKGWCKIISYLWIWILTNSIITGGFALFIVPGITFAVWFILAPYVLITEDLKGMNTFFRGKQLVAGKWWSIFWRFLIIVIIIYVIILLSPFFIDKIAVFFFGYSSVGGYFNGLLSGFINYFLLIPFSAIFGFLLYEELKRLKSGVLFEPPKRGTKIKYILVGLLGLAVLLAFLFWFYYTMWMIYKF